MSFERLQVFRSIDSGSLKGFPKDIVLAESQVHTLVASCFLKSILKVGYHMPSLYKVGFEYV